MKRQRNGRNLKAVVRPIGWIVLKDDSPRQLYFKKKGAPRGGVLVVSERVSLFGSRSSAWRAIRRTGRYAASISASAIGDHLASDWRTIAVYPSNVLHTPNSGIRGVEPAAGSTSPPCVCYRAVWLLQKRPEFPEYFIDGFRRCFCDELRFADTPIKVFHLMMHLPARNKSMRLI